MARRGGRSLMHAPIPDDPIPGIIGGLAITALLGGITAGSLLLAVRNGGFVYYFLGGGILGVGQTLVSLNKLPAFLKYERLYEPDPRLRPSHRTTAIVAACLVVAIIIEILVALLAWPG